MAKPITTEYVNNALFLELLKDYISIRDKARSEGKERPRIPDSIGLIFVNMSTRLASRFNFVRYTFKEDMIGDGILNAVEAINSFDPEKGTNPFGYFTKIMFWAFCRRIQKEKKLRETHNSLMYSVDEDTFSIQEGDTFSIEKNDIYMFKNS